jgi:hypothetical protein
MKSKTGAESLFARPFGKGHHGAQKGTTGNLGIAGQIVEG